MGPMKSCTKCLTAETAEAITFDTTGTCSVCRQIEYKEEKVDWPARAKELMERVWSIDAVSDVAPLVEAMAKPKPA